MAIQRQSAQLDLNLDKGATFRQVITWKAGTQGNETLVDLTGASARMQFRPSVTSDVLLFESTDANGGVILGGTAGTIELFISSTDTSNFTFDSCMYGLEVTLANGDVRHVIRGKITLYAELVR